jgi:hypothetical protein
MKIEFHKAVGAEDNPHDPLIWAETEFGGIAPGEEEGTISYIQPAPEKELLMTLELPEIPRESLESIAENMLRKGIPLGELPPNSAEALFFTVVNDAITKLKEMIV